MSFFSCDIDRARFRAANPRLPLYPGQVNHWLVLTEGQASERDVQRAVEVALALMDLPFSTAGLSPDARDIRVDEWQVGPPSTLPRGAQRVQEMPEAALPAGYIYASVSFLYAGTRVEVTPWPWLTRGLVIECPEDVIAGVLAVLPPTVATKEPLGTLEQIGDSLSTATKVVLWGGAALLLLRLAQLTKPPARAVRS